jgi:hypothetical protein
LQWHDVHCIAFNFHDDDDIDCDVDGDCAQVVCSALYIVAMQSWWRPQCGQYGPNNLLYASILINCFLIYVILRYTHGLSYPSLSSLLFPALFCALALFSHLWKPSVLSPVIPYL